MKDMTDWWGEVLREGDDTEFEIPKEETVTENLPQLVSSSGTPGGVPFKKLGTPPRLFSSSGSPSALRFKKPGSPPLPVSSSGSPSCYQAAEENDRADETDGRLV